MREIKVNGQNICLFEEGTGSPLFLIHGLGNDHSIWKLQQQALSQYFRVIAYDVRGHGCSSRDTNYTLVDHANDLAQLMDELEIDRAHIMGLSMGTYICQQFISLFPKKVDRMILAATKPAGKTSATQKLIDDRQAKGDPIDIEQITEIAVKACFLGNVSQEKLNIFYEASRYNTMDSYQEAMKALTNFDFRPALPNVASRTLIINGDKDVLTTLEEAMEVHALIPGSKLAVFEECGHLCNIEQFERFNAEVLSYLTSA